MKELLDKAEKIAEGQNSVIWYSNDNKYDQPVVLKLLKDEFDYYPNTTLLQNEYENLRGLDHSGIRKVLDLFRSEKRQILVLEHFDGVTLKSLIKKNKTPFISRLELAINICEVLAYVHDQHIVHKDINPYNTLVNNLYEVSVIDFGLSTEINIKQNARTIPDQLKGTLPYISPEQTGRMNQAVDHRSDLYSFGILLYELFGGRLPFDFRDPLELVHAHLAIRPTRLSEVNDEVPEIVSTMVSKLLEKDVEKRYQSAHGLLNDLKRCRSELNRKVKIEPFTLAENDQNGQFILSSKLYGRDDDVHRLLRSFTRHERSQKSVTLVSGHSGTGKTSLVNTVQQAVAERKGYFIQGKHEQYQHDIPYQAIAQAITAFVKQILTEDEEQLSYWRALMINALGHEGKLLTEIAPDLELVIGRQEDLRSLGLNESQNRFNYIFLAFIKAISSQEHPLVMFIDDLQWTDSASLQLLKELILSVELKHFYFIGAYRSNEVDDAHPMSFVFEEIGRALEVNRIETKDLCPEHVQALIQDSFKCDEQEARQLAEVVSTKTAGNPFFVNQFLKTIYEKGLLKFGYYTDEGSGLLRGRWSWNVSEIIKMNFTDNVVEFMIDNLKLLSEKEQNVLKLASCIGVRFDLKTIYYISEKPYAEIKDSLWKVLREQLIVPYGYNPVHVQYQANGVNTENMHLEYRFAHDRVRQAAYEMILDEQKAALHQHIGQLLLSNMKPEEVKENVFEVVFHLNKGNVNQLQLSEKIRLAELNFTAGSRAKASSAYQNALSYFEVALGLLREQMWKDSIFPLCWDLHIAAMECAYLQGEYAKMHQLADGIFLHSQSVYQEIDAHRIIVLAYVAQNQFNEAIDYGIKQLKRLGVRFPAKPSKVDIIVGLVRTKLKLRNVKPEYFLEAPAMTDPQVLALVDLIVSFGAASYHKRPNLFPLVVFKLIELTLKHGVSNESLTSLVTYGLLLCGVTGEIDRGFAFGKVAKDLLNTRSDAMTVRAKTMVTYYTFINHWKAHLGKSLEMLNQAYTVGRETGDHEYAAAALFMHSCHSFLSGENLKVLIPKVKQYALQSNSIRQQSYGLYTSIVHEGMVNLVERKEDLLVLKGDVFNEEEFLSHIDQRDFDHTAYMHLYFNKLFLAYTYEKYEKAVSVCKELQNHLDAAVSTIYTPVFYFYYSLSLVAWYWHDQPGKRKVLSRVRSNQKKMKKWAAHAPMNFRHMYLLVEAEVSAILGQYEKAEELYNQSISRAKKSGFVNHQAIGNELAARYYHRRTQPEDEGKYFKRAVASYKQWGALGKVSLLQEQYAHWFEEEGTGEKDFKSVTFHTSGTSQLDISTILKAASAISSEIQLNKAVPRLLRIVMENAGAQKGYFFLKENDKLLAYAKGDIDADITMLDPVPLGSCADLAQSVVQYVYRTQQRVVISDARVNSQFSFDPYIKEYEVHSVLSFPIMYHASVQGIIYLENNLTKGAFTSNRVDLLNLLSGQIAVTLNNAVLYDHLEQKVEERTQKIEEQKNQLKSLNEEKDNLINIVSHDLRTPLAVIRGFANLARQRVKQANIDEYTGPIIEASQRLEKMISRILDVSAINARKLDLILQEFDAVEVVRQIVSEHQIMAQNKLIELTMKSNADIGLITLDRSYFTQVVDNLLSNAIKYSPRESLVELHTQYTDQKLLIEVRDHGPGISKYDQKFLFNNFRKLSAKPTGGEASTGLGLSIAKKYVDEMGGNIWCESEEGKGAAFFLEFYL